MSGDLQTFTALEEAEELLFNYDIQNAIGLCFAARIIGDEKFLNYTLELLNSLAVSREFVR